jgi:two-component system chemotaxis response regulator CheB
MMVARVIGIGGSAGSIAALRRIVKDLPTDVDAAVAVTVHIPPQGPSILPEIIGRATPLQVVSAVDGAALERGKMYFAPPDHHLVVERDRVKLGRGPRESGARPAVDVLLRSIARAHGARGIGVVLTGALDDGTAGLYALKGFGGVAIVQDPADAEVPSMPESALRHVQVDHCVPASAIGALLGKLTRAAASATEVTGPIPFDPERPVDTEPAVFTCPDCDGPLWEVRHANLVRVQCRVGHAFSPLALGSAQAERLERATYAALRSLRQSATVQRRLAELARERGQAGLAAEYDAVAREHDEHAQALSELSARPIARNGTA